MRAAMPFRLLLVPALALFAAACGDSDSPLEPPIAEEAAPLHEGPAAVAAGRWADGYLLAIAPDADRQSSSSFAPLAGYSYNRSGGAIKITQPAGTTGRYIATFSGLSALLGARNTVHVTAAPGSSFIHCKPVKGYLLNDKVEVRCFSTSSGAPANAAFSLVVLRKSAGRAFAYAHQPTATSYSPHAKGSWNSAGAIKVVRAYKGYYQVLFDNLGSQLSTHGGHVQVNAVGAGSAHCKLAEEWGGSPNLGIQVQCYDRTGFPVDSKFTVLFQLPAPNLAYAYSNQSLSTYSPSPFWSSNPAGGSISVTRFRTGEYIVDWSGVDARIIDGGNVQVTGLGVNDYSHCVTTGGGPNGAAVRCFAPNGTPVDTHFTVLLGS